MAEDNPHPDMAVKQEDGGTSSSHHDNTTEDSPTTSTHPPVDDGEGIKQEPEEASDNDGNNNNNNNNNNTNNSKDDNMELEPEEQGADHDKDIEQDGDSNDEEEEQETMPLLGGKVETKAFCLLDGIFEQKDGVQQRITIPLSRLPAVLGRSHTTDDINFFSLGPAKALSRQHCVIDYRDDTGGRLMTPKRASRDSPEEETLEYEKPVKGKPFHVVGATTAADVAQQKDEDTADKHQHKPYPPRGSFVLEALGKNLIMVGSQRLRQGEVAILSSGTPIRMSSYSLYFLLPSDTSDPPKTMTIPLDESASPAAKKNNKTPSPLSSSLKKAGMKRKMPSMSNKPTTTTTTSSSPEEAPTKKIKAPPFAQLQADLDAMPIEMLLEKMDEAVESERWERKHQLIGSTIALHAVKDATSAPEILAQAVDGGVARTEIMRWIRESPKYSGWVEQMMTKMEAKSYQNTITKALLKAGNVRTGSGGRYIKWMLPGVTLHKSASGDADGADDKKASASGATGGQQEEENEEEEEGEEDEGEEEEDGEEEGEDEDADGGEEEEEDDGDGDNEDADEDDANEGEDGDDANDENASEQEGEGGEDDSS